MSGGGGGLWQGDNAGMAALSRNKRRNWLRLPKPDGYAQMTKTQQRNWRVKQAKKAKWLQTKP